MSVTLVTQRRARPGQGAILVAAAIRLFAESRPWNPARLRVRLFQGRDPPDALLIVAEWASRVAAERHLHETDEPAVLDPLCVGKATREFYHQLTSYEPLTGPVVAARCTLVECPRPALPDVLSFLLDVSGPALRAQPGLVLHELHQSADRPTRLLTIRGWASEAALECALRHLAPLLEGRLGELGARLAPFIGHSLTEVGDYRGL